MSESLFLALGSADATIGAAANGADLIGVGGVVNGLTQAIVAAKHYKSIKDLRGATIGVQVLTFRRDQRAKAYLETKRP